jgi:hypothetical protein
MEAQFVNTSKTNFGFKRLKKFNTTKPVTETYPKTDKSVLQTYDQFPYEQV